MKVESNLFMIIDSVRCYESSCIKTNRYDLIYKSLFTFMNESLSGEVNKCSPFITSLSLSTKPKTTENNSRDIYLLKIYHLLILNYMSNPNIPQTDKEYFNDETQKLMSYFNKETLLSSSKKSSPDYQDLKISASSFTLIGLIVRYTAQFQKTIKNSPDSKVVDSRRGKVSNSSSLSVILAENARIETQLKTLLTDLFNYAFNGGVYQLLLFNYLIEVLIFKNSSHFNDTRVCCKYYQNSFFDLFVTVANLYTKAIKVS